MSYAVKEVFYTLQGEGARSGSAAVFLRFAGCNLWNGHEEARPTASCRFCDTDFLGGQRFATAEDLAEHVAETWEGELGDGERPRVVCTGGEPLLQLDRELVEALHGHGFEVAVETNGTLLPPDGVDWITVSPKAGIELALLHGDELKVVWPQPMGLEQFEDLPFAHLFLQPMDGPAREANVRAVIERCLARPRWRLSLQTHKMIGVR